MHEKWVTESQLQKRTSPPKGSSGRRPVMELAAGLLWPLRNLLRARLCQEVMMIHDHGKRGRKLLRGVVGVLSHANLSDELVGGAPVDATNIAYQFVTQVCTFGR